MFVPALLYVVFLASAASAWAGVGAADSPGVSGAAFSQMLSGLVLIIGLLLGTAFLMRKLNGGRAFGQAGPMRIVAQLMISARERVVLLEVGEQWVVVGQPDERWLRKASGRAGKVFVFAYGDRLVDVWWEQNRDKLEKLPNLVVYRLTADDAQALAGLANRTMSLQCTIQEGELLITSDDGSLRVEPEILLGGAE